MFLLYLPSARERKRTVRAHHDTAAIEPSASRCPHRAPKKLWREACFCRFGSGGTAMPLLLLPLTPLPPPPPLPLPPLHRLVL